MIGNRIKQLRESLLLTQQDFANLIKVSRSYLGNIESCAKEPSFNFIQSLIETTEVNLNWVITGEGEMYRRPANQAPTIEEIDKNLKGLTEGQRQEILSRTDEMLLINTMRKEVDELREKFDSK